ncbi:alkaline phosphatase [Clostridiaceae bacterium M8S5]|nr:alkaline phosphatase [Clostridiaceae bacterium M8S5]
MKKKSICIVLLLTIMVTLSLFNGPLTTIASTNNSIKPIAKTPKYVFYFIGDGMGSSQRQISEYYLQKLTKDDTRKLIMNTFPCSAINTTHSMDTVVTDSAAAGTALATGFKANNGVISKDADGNNLVTLIEAAKDRGMATGIATTTRVTHATPAVFISHNENRGNENDIAFDMLDSSIDYLVGGGARHFIPKNFTTIKDCFGKDIKSKRTDYKNILNEFSKKGYSVDIGLTGSKNFKNTNFKYTKKYIGLFSNSHLPYTLDDYNNNTYDAPTLAEMTKNGIDLLSKDKDGFFFMIEGGRIDHACHPNDAPSAIMDTLAFDNAIKKAYDFYLKHPEDTLILVMGDHETGGLGMGVNTDYFLTLEKLFNAKMSIESLEGSYNGNRNEFYKLIEKNFGLCNLTKTEKELLEKSMAMSDESKFSEGNRYKYDETAMAVTHILSKRAGIYWTSYAHTATQIPMSAIGAGSELYNGFLDNTEIAKLTAKILKLELSK